MIRWVVLQEVFVFLLPERRYLFVLERNASAGRLLFWLTNSSCALAHHVRQTRGFTVGLHSCCSRDKLCVKKERYRSLVNKQVIPIFLLCEVMSRFPVRRKEVSLFPCPKRVGLSTATPPRPH